MKTLMSLLAIFIIAAGPSASLAGEITGIFRDVTGKNVQHFVIPNLNTATKPELAAIFLKTCQPPLTYTKDGRFYCSKGSGPHQMMTSSPKDRQLVVDKLMSVDLLKKK